MIYTAHKLLRNIQKDPFNPKYRIISTNSQRLNELFFKTKLGQSIVNNMGFNYEFSDNGVEFYKNSCDEEKIKNTLEIFQKAETHN